MRDEDGGVLIKSPVNIFPSARILDNGSIYSYYTENITNDYQVVRLKELNTVNQSLTNKITDTKNILSSYISNTFNNLNICNGTGSNSLVQRYTGETTSTNYQSSAIDTLAISLGQSNINGSQRTLIVGKLNASGIQAGHNDDGTLDIPLIDDEPVLKNNGKNSLIGGLYNINNGNSSIISGLSNTNLYDNSIISGSYNINASLNSLVVGHHNDNRGDNNIMIGHHLISESYVKRSPVSNSLIVGYYNKVDIGGLFQVGFGSSNNNRANAFEVLMDGRARVATTPHDDNDVVRLCDITQTIIPKENEKYNLGDSSTMYNTIFAKWFNGTAMYAITSAHADNAFLACDYDTTSGTINEKFISIEQRLLYLESK